MTSITFILTTVVEELLPLYGTHERALPYAWWILEHVTGLSASQLIVQGSLSTEQQEQLYALIKKHVECLVPLQYILGEVPFLDTMIKVCPPILIPRPETEYWCSLIIECLKRLKNQALTILDLCTGSGCIALACAQALPNAHVYAIDINQQACIVAEENKKHNQISNVTIIQSDLYKNLPLLSFDLILSNPPYISKEEWLTLDPMVKEWEDTQALISADEGLECLKSIILQAPAWLKTNKEFTELGIPQLVVECGYAQGTQVKNICEQAGFKTVFIKKDLSEKERFVVASMQVLHKLYF